MRHILTFLTILFFAGNLFSQTIEELVSQGTALHDQGKYDEAIAKYKEALAIDKNSSLANYELSYTYMVTGQYEEAARLSKIVIKQKDETQHGGYIVLGSSLDMLGKPEKAIQAYEEGLEKFPKSNLLNYNLALTAYNQKENDKAEKAAIDAVMSKPSHGSSHLVLSAIMKAKGQRAKSILPLYYFLMVEPTSNRSASNFNSLKEQLGQGVKKQGEKNINVSVPLSPSIGNDFGAAEMLISLKAASGYTEENKDKSEIELFIETTRSFFSILGELKKDNTGFWWDFYVPKFYDLVQTNNYEAFGYYISQSVNQENVKKWISDNPDKMEHLIDWLNK